MLNCRRVFCLVIYFYCKRSFGYLVFCLKFFNLKVVYVEIGWLFCCIYDEDDNNNNNYLFEFGDG